MVIPMRRRIRRVMDLFMLGRMVEKAISDPHEEVYLKRWSDDDPSGLCLRVDGTWPLTASQVRVIERAFERTWAEG